MTTAQFCFNRGASMAAAAQFCANRGATVAGSVPFVQQPTAAPANAAPYSPAAPKSSAGMLLAGVVLLVALAAGAYFLVLKDDSDSSSGPAGTRTAGAADSSGWQTVTVDGAVQVPVPPGWRAEQSSPPVRALRPAPSEADLGIRIEEAQVVIIVLSDEYDDAEAYLRNQAEGSTLVEGPKPSTYGRNLQGAEIAYSFIADGTEWIVTDVILADKGRPNTGVAIRFQTRRESSVADGKSPLALFLGLLDRLAILR